MTPKRIIVTGGSGQVGQHVIAYLLEKGHDILNLDLVPLPDHLAQHVHTLRVDLTDSGHVHSALTSRFHPACPFGREPLNQIPDAVIHLASYPRNMIVPDGETYRVNTQAGYNVIEAACRLGIKKIIIASTVCVYGPAYAEGEIDFPSFPVDEEVDASPMDTYAISKVCVERTARGFARRFASKGVDVYVFRIAAVIRPGEYARFLDGWKENAADFKAVGWSYTDARDFGQMCHLAVLRDGLGYQIFNATNDEIVVDGISTTEFLGKVASGVPFTREMGEKEAPLTNRKIKELLGFKEEHSWRKYYSYT
ncbi:NAD-dependent epimerase/dehydratase family protein [Aspergillus lucknowensis]|uniref:NAD-dependent epimerase/dehydratase domain-containing protein n=1 Tax=Aspergillus lucknowensis TaxID=176173 RepID=A0ABR4LTS2_9EURO